VPTPFTYYQSAPSRCRYNIRCNDIIQPLSFMFFRYRRFSACFILLGLCLFTSYVGYKYWVYIQRTISYASRPLWDVPDGPNTVISHYYAEGLKVIPKVCALHGWNAREKTADGHGIEAWDAVLFSGELDLLEVRLNELDDSVDRFFIIESNRTFTGRPKPLIFSENRGRFSRFDHKIIYEPLLGSPADPETEDPWVWEAHQRDAMSALLRSHLPSTPRPPLVLFSDVDEIPAAHTIRLLKGCAFVGPLHLQMRTYMYSFEWPTGLSSWRAQVHEWDEATTYYRHSMASDNALADAGWHCSYCFRSLAEFSEKMQGFSHADRLAGDPSLLSPERIQQVICQGKDIFNMLPEVYSYRDMIRLLNPERSKSMIDIPKFLIENEERFQFLLPGGCQRKS